METNPHFYGLSPRTKLVELNTNEIGIHKVIKSRLIKKDAEKIVVIARRIIDTHPSAKVSLICSRNICSKSLNLLKEKGVDVKYEDEF